jgi:hypothetical protein
MQNRYFEKAVEFFDMAREEFERAVRERDIKVVQDGCGKAWLSIIEATKGFLLSKGVKEEQMPRTYRGIRFMLGKYAGKEIRNTFRFTFGVIHVEGYYDGIIEFEEIPEIVAMVEDYLKKMGVYDAR